MPTDPDMLNSFAAVIAERNELLAQLQAAQEALAEIVGFAQEVQRGTQPGDAHECGKHIERIALSAQRTGG